MRSSNWYSLCSSDRLYRRFKTRIRTIVPVGYGGRPNAEGIVQLDSCCMHGPRKQAGGVAALEGVTLADMVKPPLAFHPAKIPLRMRVGKDDWIPYQTPKTLRQAKDEAERVRFWAGRKNAFPAVGRISPDYYCMDGTIPRRELPGVLKGISEWLPNWKARNWKTAAKKPVMNVDLWQQLDKLAAQHTIRWQWVKGHSGHRENEIADQLANRGIDELANARRRGGRRRLLRPPPYRGAMLAQYDGPTPGLCRRATDAWLGG